MWNTANFNSGNGEMSKEAFFTWANRVGVMDTVWLAKYFGVGLNTVKLWVTEYLNERK